jgi:hypothetical protein
MIRKHPKHFFFGATLGKKKKKNQSPTFSFFEKKKTLHITHLLVIYKNWIWILIDHEISIQVS